MAINHKTYLLDFLEEMQPLRDCVRYPSKPKAFDGIIAEIKRSPDEASIIKLFEHAGSDFRDPRAWYAMIGLFAEHFFIEKRGGTREMETAVGRDYSTGLHNLCAFEYWPKWRVYR